MLEYVADNIDDFPVVCLATLRPEAAHWRARWRRGERRHVRAGPACRRRHSRDGACLPVRDEAGYLAAQQALFAAAHPWFQVRKLTARSHFPMFEVPDAIAAEIEAFVNQPVAFLTGGRPRSVAVGDGTWLAVVDCPFGGASTTTSNQRP